jgi:hypothetical protein
MKQHGGKDRYRDEAPGGEAHGGEHLHDGGGIRVGHATVPDGTAPVESLIGYLLKQTQTALRARMDEALRPLELTTPQYSCLEALNGRPGASTSEIARAVFVTRQTMNTLLRGLQERGLVERIPTPRADAPSPSVSRRRARGCSRGPRRRPVPWNAP